MMWLDARPQRQLVAPAGRASAATARSRSARCESPARRSRSAPTGRSRASTRARGWPPRGCGGRRGIRERAPYDDQALDGLAALEGYTTGAAFAGGDEHRLGRIRPGFCADLTVFAEDPVECDADDLVELPVVLTVVDGEIVLRA